ncbi:MAG: isoprenylcysteine carboxylmethyltransferase family protein [Pseudomonadota bacterium]|nr:isoprenylcysteine carboxylmethyltransferase family protein [Pseudomonadota bacterium]
MTKLELKMPPLLQVLIAAGIMQVIDHTLAFGQIQMPFHIMTSGLIAAAGLLCISLSLLTFKKYKTTVDPLHLEKNNTLITQGIFKKTRNPIYLAFVLFLLAYFYFLGQVLNIAVILGFIIYMTRFQIIPEERFLLKRYGQEYVDYMSLTRRWI